MYGAKEIILSEIKPALGCTEPAAVALNAAYLREYGVFDEKNLKLTVNTNLLKNAMYVPIPNTSKRFGVKLAFALGYLFGDVNDGLNIFKNLNEEKVKKALEFSEKVKVELIEGSELFIKSENSYAEAVTIKFHDNIEYVISKGELKEFDNHQEEVEVKSYVLEDKPFDIVYDLIEQEKSFEFVKEAVELNMALAEYGMNHDVGINVSKQFSGDSLKDKICKITTSASDSRMDGVNMPAMSLTGSGNHGISATLPVWVYAKEKGFSEEEALKSVALSMLITIYIKLFIGRLSVICGAAVASGCGVAGAIAYLEGDRETSKKAVKHVIQNIGTLLCDGGKMACSLKVLQGASVGYDSAKFALNAMEVYEDGIMFEDVTKTIKALKGIKEKMSGVDEEIVKIMKEKLL
ncbi:L-cysteine desulfidase family protein [Caminibacter pacificus]